MPHLLRSVCVATARIDSDDHRLDVIVLGKSLNITAYSRPYYAGIAHQYTLRLLLHDAAFAVIYGNLIVGAGIQRSKLRHLTDAYLRNGVFVSNLQELLYLALHLVRIESGVDKALLLVFISSRKLHHLVGISIERVGRNLATLAYIAHESIPYTIEIYAHLLAVGIAHAVLGESLSGALVLSHLDHLDFNAYFIEKIADKLRFGGQAMPCQHTLRIDPNLISCACYIVCALRIIVSIRSDKLARLFEVHYHIA